MKLPEKENLVYILKCFRIELQAQKERLGFVINYVMSNDGGRVFQTDANLM